MTIKDWEVLNKLFDPTKVPLFIYHGSLTSTPCSENILWMVLKYPAVISHETVII